MAVNLLVLFVSIVSGVVQSLTGFGAGVLLMLFLPKFFGIQAAPAISGSIIVFLSSSLAIKNRKHLKKKVIAPLLIYFIAGQITILFIKKLNLSFLSVVFGAFLVVLAVLKLFLTDRINIKDNNPTMAVISLVSGIFSGLFNTGGPLMIMYTLAAFEDRKEYTANTQFIFFVSGVALLISRIAAGIYTPDLIPCTLFGIAGVTIGRWICQKYLSGISSEVFKKIVYVTVGLCGMVTLIKYIF